VITFYTAGPWHDRAIVKGVRDKLVEADYKVNSRWLDIPENPPEGMSYEEYQQMQARNDLADVVSADVLMYVNTGYKSEGKATELGVAIAMLKPIIIIGDRSNNIFLNLGMPCFADIDAAIDFLKEEEYKEMLANRGA